MEDYSYLGSGQIYVREYGSQAPLIEVGNCSALNLSPQVESKELPDYTTPGGGLRNEVSRNKGVDIAYTFHDFSPENLARALRGGTSSVAAGTAAAEAAVAYAGGFIPLAKIPTAITTVKSVDDVTTYVDGVDYEARPGGIFILAGTTIPAPVAGAANVHVNYTYADQDKVEAMIDSAKQYEIVFAGMNEARSGKVTRIQCWKASSGVMAQFAAIGQDYGAGEVSGKLLADTTKTGTGISKYFLAELEK